MTTDHRPESYRESRCCWTCEHAVSWPVRDYAPDPIYCAFDSPPRPPCVDNDEDDGYNELRAGEHPDKMLARNAALKQAWNEWSQHRAVEAHGVCNQHERMKDE